MTKSKSKITIRICSSLEPRLKQQWNQMIWLAKELGCGIAGCRPLQTTEAAPQMAPGPGVRVARRVPGSFGGTHDADGRRCGLPVYSQPPASRHRDPARRVEGALSRTGGSPPGSA